MRIVVLSVWLVVVAWPGVAAGAAPKSRSASSAPPEDPLVRKALSACLEGDRHALATSYREAFAREQAAGDQQVLRTSDAIRFLYNNSLTDREPFLEGSEQLLADAESEELRTSILRALLSDEYYELAILKGENRFNRFTRIFNRASSAVSRMALFQPQAAAQLVLEGVHATRKGRLPTDRERRMVFLGGAFLEKYPQAPEAPEVSELLNQLKAKMDGERAARDRTAGLAFLEKGQLQAAEFHLERAAALQPGNEEAAKGLSELRRLAGERERMDMVAVTVTGREGQLSEADVKRMESACYALVRGDDKALAEIGNESPALTDSANYALAGLVERLGRHTEALRRLDGLAQSSPGSPGGRAAKVLLANPSYHLEAAFDESLREVDRRRRDYVLTGQRTGEDTAFALGNAALEVGPSGTMVGLPALFLTDMLVRGVAERFRSQVAIDDALDAGERLRRRYPNSPRAQEAASVLAGLADRGGDIERTEDYLAAAGGANAKEQAKLREDKARTLYAEAKDSANLAERKKLLEELLQNYPEQKIAETARKEFEKLAPTLEVSSLILSRPMLQRHTGLAQSLGVSAEWLDGSKGNGEVTEEGVTLDADGKRATFRLREEPGFRQADIAPENRQTLLAEARQLRISFERTESGKKHKALWVPFSIEGGAGSDGVEIAPKIQPRKDDPERTKYFSR